MSIVPRSMVLTIQCQLRNWAKYPSFNCTRFFQQDVVHYKRRKTAEEKKSDRIIEYSPKKKTNKIITTGIVDIWRNMTVQELANSAGKDLEHIQEVMLYVKGANDLDPNARLEDPTIIKDIVQKCGMKMKIIAAPSNANTILTENKNVFKKPPALPEKLQLRPPVVTVMGHVDHGKTTLLDSLRGASVAAGEAGGITQHIGAFMVELDNGEKVAFLDTPGHAAFSAMRTRGANLTDIIVLVVAAEDGVMQQTREVVKLAQDARVPIIVAVNKIDKPEADIEKTKRELMQLGLSLEGYGGDTQVVGISALKGINLDGLTEAVSTQATLMGLKADYTGAVEGVVVESKTDSRRGKLSTAIVTRGTLRRGAILVSGIAWAKVRGLFDHAGQPLEAATPGTPVEILGWRELPFAGEEILEVESEKEANSVIKWRETQAQKVKANSDKEIIELKQLEHDEQYRAAREARRRAGHYKTRRVGPRQKEIGDLDSTPRVSVIIKGDVHGSVEAILDVLDTYNGHKQCRLDVVHYGVGDVNEGDIELSKLFNAIIYAFSVSKPPQITKDVRIREINVIYRLVEDLKTEISKKLPLQEVEETLGEANILQLFDITEGKREVHVMGCRCSKGVLKKNAKFKVLRNNELLHTDELDSMRHLKNEVDTIKKDVECGLRLKSQNFVPQIGDTLVCFKMNIEPQFTDWDPGF